MNRASLIGNLTKDPELRTTSSGISVCTFSIAVSRPFNKDETDYLPIVTWRKLAENCAQYLSKGKKVGVSGRIQVRSYERNDGSKAYVTEIIADEVEFLSLREPKPEPIKDSSGLIGEDFEPLEDQEEMPF